MHAGTLEHSDSLRLSFQQSEIKCLGLDVIMRIVVSARKLILAAGRQNKDVCKTNIGLTEG